MKCYFNHYPYLILIHPVKRTKTLVEYVFLLSYLTCFIPVQFYIFFLSYSYDALNDDRSLALSTREALRIPAIMRSMFLLRLTLVRNFKSVHQSLRGRIIIIFLFLCTFHRSIADDLHDGSPTGTDALERSILLTPQEPFPRNQIFRSTRC